MYNKNNKIIISFADFSHTGKTIDTNYFPLGVAYVAAYAIKIFGDQLKIDLFKYPREFSAYLDQQVPQLACFSNFSWNFNLAYEYARQIKRTQPTAITVFGGPNYSNLVEEQAAFLKDHPAIDFYIVEEGEIPFANLLASLMAVDFDLARFYPLKVALQGVHYYANQQLTVQPPNPRIQDLCLLPSPILSGIMDKFVNGAYIPMVQTTRGCPYACTFCHDGTRYQNKLKRFPEARYRQEIDYIAARTQMTSLCIPDLNFGIFEEDYATAEYIAKTRKSFNWPQSLDITAAKNNKKRISRIVELLGNIFLMGASVQSTDQAVLSTIKRKNLPIKDLIAMANKSAEAGGNSFSEVILCLPSDTKHAHFKSVMDLIDGRMDEVRMYQFILLAGTEGGSDAARKQYGYETKWRVLPRCSGIYTIFGEDYAVAEIHEVCVANNTMSHQDYLACRKLNLIVEIFNNGKVFGELFKFLDLMGIARSDILQTVYQKAIADTGMMGAFLSAFEENEDKNFFQSREAIETFLQQPGSIEKYLSGEYGTNQIMAFRSEALIERLDFNATFIFDIVRAEMVANNALDEIKALYLEELCAYILACRGNLLSSSETVVMPFHFDFVALFSKNFNVNPLDFWLKTPAQIKIGHSAPQKQEMDAVFQQFGRTIDGLGHLLQRANVFKLYRGPSYCETV